MFSHASIYRLWHRELDFVEVWGKVRCSAASVFGIYLFRICSPEKSLESHQFRSNFSSFWYSIQKNKLWVIWGFNTLLFACIAIHKRSRNVWNDEKNYLLLFFYIMFDPCRKNIYLLKFCSKLPFCFPI